jgi:hypothetical protein
LSQNAGRSSGLRLVMSVFGPAVQTWTSLSAQSPPAFLMSVSRLGQEVRVRPRTRSASTRIHGPWQMTAAGLPAFEHALHEADRRRDHPQEVAVRDVAWHHDRVVLGVAGIADRAVHGEGIALVEIVEGLDLAPLGRDQFGRAARAAHRVPRSGEFHLLHALVRGQESDAQAVQFACHQSNPFGSTSSELTSPAPQRPLHTSAGKRMLR